MDNVTVLGIMITVLFGVFGLVYGGGKMVKIRKSGNMKNVNNNTIHNENINIGIDDKILNSDKNEAND